MDEIENLAEQIGRRADDVGVTVGVAESLTGGLVVQALAKADGASGWLRGGIVAYARNVKHTLLQVDVSKVVSERAALAMAAGVRKVLEADVAVALTGVGGPDEEDGEPPGTVWIATDDGAESSATLYRFDGPPSEICEQARVAALTALRDRFTDDQHRVQHVGG
jgi:nicotinamide-nucleotide amidase